MTKARDLMPHDTTNLFKMFVYAVWGTVTLYSIFYYFMGAFFSTMAVALGVFVLCPLTIVLEKKKHHRTARMLFIVSCNFYIYTTSLGFGHSINTEYYSLCAPMIGLLINDFDDYWAMGVAVFLPALTRVMTITLGVNIIAENWVFIPESKNVFIAVNFFGAFFLATLLISLFVKTIKEQRLKIISTAKMSSLGEMAGGIAHEINTPLTIIAMRVEQLERRIAEGRVTPADLLAPIKIISTTTQRIAKIVKGLRLFSREGSKDSLKPAFVDELVQETLAFCLERFRSHGVQVNLISSSLNRLQINCRSVEMSQVFLNLLNNSFDAIQNLDHKWIHIEIVDKSFYVEVSFKDSGRGIPKELHDKIMLPFFTTKGIGSATGLGLSLSKGIIESHAGGISIDELCSNTRFVVEIPKHNVAMSKAA